MADYVLVVHTKPVEGQEDEYNAWYDNQHLGDVLQVPGFVAARRYKLSDNQDAPPYLALYEIESDDPDAVMTELARRSSSGEMVMSAALGDASAVMYKAIGPRKTS